MKTNPRFLLVLLLASACGGVTEMPTETAQQSSALQGQGQSLKLADELLAKSVRHAGLVQGFYPFLAPDAVYLEPSLDIVRGRDAIRDALSAKYPDPSALTLQLHHVASGQSADGELGYSFGWFEELPAAGPTAYRKYLATWRRTGGHWRLEAFVKSGGTKPPTAPPEGNPVVAGYHGVSLPGDPSALAADAAAADTAFAALSADQDYCAAFPAFADDNAVVIGNSNFYWGIEWVRLAYSGCTPQVALNWAPVYSASTGSGDLAWTVGNAVFSFDDGTTVSNSYSKYLTVWARQADGSWKWLLDAGNARPAP